MYPRSMVDSDCVVIQGSNMAECHPVAFRWPMQAKLKGAKLIHVDPRFTRTSAVADIHAPIRAGSDVAFLGGLIHHVLQSERWNTDPFFREFVVNYTNAATVIDDQFKDTEDLDGVFSGLLKYTPGIKEWPLDGFVGQYDTRTWQYAAASAAPRATPPPAAAGKHRPAWRRCDGAPGACLHPGLDRYPDALPLDPRVHESPVGVEAPRLAPRLAPHRNNTAGLLGQYPEVHGLVSQVDVRGGGDEGERLRLRLAPEDHRRSLPPPDVRGHERRTRERHAVHRPEPGDIAQRERRAEGARPARVARGQGQLAHGDRHVLAERPGDHARPASQSGH